MSAARGVLRKHPFPAVPAHPTHGRAHRHAGCAAVRWYPRSTHCKCCPARPAPGGRRFRHGRRYSVYRCGCGLPPHRVPPPGRQSAGYAPGRFPLFCPDTRADIRCRRHHPRPQYGDAAWSWPPGRSCRWQCPERPRWGFPPPRRPGGLRCPIRRPDR